jgi:hypothetical protein
MIELFEPLKFKEYLKMRIPEISGLIAFFNVTRFLKYLFLERTLAGPFPLERLILSLLFLLLMLRFAYVGLLGVVDFKSPYRIKIRGSLPLRKFRMVKIHELIHYLKRIGYFKFDIPQAQAAAILWEVELTGETKLYREEFKEGIRLVKEISDAEQREKEAIRIAKIRRIKRLGRLFESYMYIPVTWKLKTGEWAWTYFYGSIVAGMAYQLGKEIEDKKGGKWQDFAWKYLRLRAYGFSPTETEEKIKESGN